MFSNDYNELGTDPESVQSLETDSKEFEIQKGMDPKLSKNLFLIQRVKNRLQSLQRNPLPIIWNKLKKVS